MKIKCGRKEFELSEKDIIFDNGSCYQLLTQTYYKGWHQHYPVISQSKAKKMIKEGNLILSKETLSYVTSEGEEVWHRYYNVKLNL